MRQNWITLDNESKNVFAAPRFVRGHAINVRDPRGRAPNTGAVPSACKERIRRDKRNINGSSAARAPLCKSQQSPDSVMQQIILIWVVFCCAVTVQASTRFVDNIAGMDAPDRGTTITEPLQTIQYALNQSYSDASVTIWLKATGQPYSEDQYQYLDFGSILDGKLVSVQGYANTPGDNPTGDSAPWIRTSNASRVIYLAHQTAGVNLGSLKLSGPSLAPGGSIIQWFSQCDLTTDNCTIGLQNETAIGIYGPRGYGVTRRLSVTNCALTCRHMGVFLECARSVLIQASTLTSYSPYDYQHIIVIGGVIGDPHNQVISTVIDHNSISSDSSTSNVRLSAITAEHSDLAKRFVVTNNVITVHSWGTCVSVLQNVPTVQIENNECYSINDTETWNQICLGTDAGPQIPVTNVLVKPERGNILIRNNWLEQPNTIVPATIANGMTNDINNGHAILIGQGVDHIECSGNMCFGCDNGIVIKGEYNSVHHNCVYGGSPCIIKGGQFNKVFNNTFVHNQHPAGSGCWAIQDKSDDASGLQPYHPSKACGNYVTDNIFVVETGFNDFCVDDNSVGGFHPLSEDNYVNNNLYYAPSSTVFSNLNWGSGLSYTFADHKGRWASYSAMFPDNDSTSTYADPLLVDPRHGDFRLMRGSPALSKGSLPGTNIGAIQNDACVGDMNQDGLVDGLDVQKFIERILLGDACP